MLNIVSAVLTWVITGFGHLPPVGSLEVACLPSGYWVGRYTDGGGGGTLHIPDIPGCVPWMTDTCSWGGGVCISPLGYRYISRSLGDWSVEQNQCLLGVGLSFVPDHVLRQAGN